jgi:hypothetical protein
MNFTMFGNPNYFNQVAPLSQHTMPCSSPSDCVFEAPAFAWNHGDVQSDITTTWFGMAGPGVSSAGRNDSVFSDHTDIRPTMLALLGLSDDYVSDGRMLMEFVAPNVVPDPTLAQVYISLAQVYKQINAPVGKLGLSSLTYANSSITSITSKDTNPYSAPAGRDDRIIFAFMGFYSKRLTAQTIRPLRSPGAIIPAREASFSSSGSG